MLRVRPSVVQGSIGASPSKSVTHRALVMGYLTRGRFTVENPLVAEDTSATLRALEALGAEVSIEGHAVHFEASTMAIPRKVIDAGNSGTTLRIMSAVTALLPGTTHLTGDESLRRRPMGPLLDALGQLGARCQSEHDKPPVAVTGPLVGSRAVLPGDVSSQFITGLLIACPLKDEATELHIAPPRKSQGYVDLTLAMQGQFGIKVGATSWGYHIPGGQAYRGSSFTVPGDYSSAAFPLVAGAIAGGPVAVRGLEPGSLQADARVVEILRDFGARVETRGGEVTVSAGPLSGQRVDVSETPDLFPILAVLASRAEGRSHLLGGEQLRYKESDRIVTTVRFLKQMGVEVTERPDGCVIEGGGPLGGALVDCEGDHRILMAAAVAGLVASGETLINHPRCFDVSYPGFLDDLKALGAEVAVA